jgi:hypothetical protein
LTEVTGQAGTVQPFDTSVVTNLNVVDELTFGDNDTGAFMATNEG